jgi:hypothetical protein
MDTPYEAAPDVLVLPSSVEIPGAGFLQTNAFLLRSAEPVLVDTGLAVDRESFIGALESVIDPHELRWIWLTHDDADHTGSIDQLMTWAPNATLVTQAFNALRMTTWWPVPLDRVRAIVPGDSVDVGDRTLVATPPPLYDNPNSLGLLDGKTGTLFSVDSFGGILPERVEDAFAVPEEALVGGMVAWGAMDSPWTKLVDRERYGRALDAVRSILPERILSSHLPPARGKIDWLVDVLETLPDADAFQPPGDAEFRQIRAHLEATAPALGA